MSRLPRILAAIAKILLTVVIVLWAAGAVVAAIAAFTSFPMGISGSVPVTIAPKDQATWEVTSSVGSDWVQEATGDWSPSSASLRTSTLAWFLVVSLLAGSAALVLHQLHGLLESIGGGTPFTEENGRRLRRIGLVVVTAEIAYAIGVFVFEKAVALRASHVTVITRFDPDWIAILVGLLVLVLAEVWRQGVKLQADADLTV